VDQARGEIGMTFFYIERRTMTKWRKNGETFEPVGPWLIDRDPKDVLDHGYFTGPYAKKDADQ
jgi:hypothetical protein